MQFPGEGVNASASLAPIAPPSRAGASRSPAKPRTSVRGRGFVRVCAGCGRKGAVPDPDSSRD
jgi:hypothetical protein